ncbi:CUB and sushi domain-containing protein 3 [Desmophyllum pertusum]|uniref:CUB and sushi domain-containing protein 3 n=1 Tax=Desmophyllum pertusum TaxID=174260 RepID=A0A9W9Z2S5_9CNID|nr:CUB and sushi domain-containing protein 3 [Desmophyllum pertusum]
MSLSNTYYALFSETGHLCPSDELSKTPSRYAKELQNRALRMITFERPSDRDWFVKQRYFQKRLLQWGFQRTDKDKNGLVDFKEFEATTKIWRLLVSSGCKRAFIEECDENQSKSLSLKEWLNCFNITPACNKTCVRGHLDNVRCQCQCAQSVIQGRVMTSSGSPLRDVGILLGSSPYTEVARTNKSGHFLRIDRCENSSYTVTKSDFVPLQLEGGVQSNVHPLLIHLEDTEPAEDCCCGPRSDDHDQEIVVTCGVRFSTKIVFYRVKECRCNCVKRETLLKEVRCGPPPAPRTGHGNVSISSDGPTTYAIYYCYPGYVLMDFRLLIVEKFKNTCDKSGTWPSRWTPACVKTCKSSDVEVDRGHIKSVSPFMIESGKPVIYTQNVVVTFTCADRYRLQGNSRRTCLDSGDWSGRNPRCVLISCGNPGGITNGWMNSSDASKFPIWTTVTFNCSAGYRLVGPSSRQCQTNGQWTARHNPTCQNENPTTSKPRESDLNKMTIVVATAGSTLGALVVLLTALVCFRRFHRSRRFRHSSFRSRRYSDDDRIAIIAAYTGDVHFILPSYDEAINQVERLPPSFESVVEGEQNSGNQLAITSNDSTASQAGSNSAAGDTNSAEQINDSARIRELTPTTEEQPIHIVSNPLADSARDTRAHAPSETVQTADHIFSSVNERGVNISDESIDTDDDDESSPNGPPESLPSSSSEEDLSSSQSQPLLGNGRRGVMV